MLTFKELMEKKSFNNTSNPKKMNDDELMDFIGWLENQKDPNPDDKDQYKKALKDAKACMKKRGFK